MFQAQKILSCVLLFALGSLHAQQYNIRSYSVEDGLGRSGVYSICEDELGRLWFGTEGGGLSCFNGSEFKNFTTKDGLCDNTVRALLADKGKGLWIATQHNGVSYFDGHHFENFNTSNGLSANHVRALAQDGNGVVWAGTFGSGICSVDPEAKTFTTKNGLASDTVRCAVVDSLGRIWFGTDQGISIFDGEHFEHITVKDGLPDSKVLCLYLAPEGVWFGTEKGGGLLGKETLILLDENAGLLNSRVRSIWKDKDGYIWFGTRKGLNKFLAEDAINGRPFILQYTGANGLSNERIRDIYQDRSGSIWFATYFGGVCQYIDEAFMHFTSADGLGNDVVTAVHLAPNGNHWFGTFGGGATRYDGSGFNTFNTLDGLPDNNVRSIQHTPEGHIIIGTESGPCALVDGRIILPQCLSEECTEEVWSLFLDKEARIWAGTTKGLGTLEVNDGKLSYYFPPMVAGQTIGQVNDIIEREDGTLMLATNKGLLQAKLFSDTLRVRTFAHIDPLLATAMNSLTLDALGHYWIGTESVGLLRFKGEKVKQFDVEDGISSNEVSLTMLDDLSDVWIGTRNGIDRLELDPLQEYVLNIDHFDAHDGFRGIETNNNSGMVDNNGDLWFGTIKGVTRYSPKQRLKNKMEPLTQITGIDLFFEPIDWKEFGSNADSWTGMPTDLELDHDRNHLTFHFIGIAQARSERVRYQFRLEGYEENWSPITAKREITYNNIPAGKHTFEVLARNGDGVWNSEPVRFSFTVLAPFWKTPWFIALAIIFLTAIIYFYIKLRLKRLEKEKTQLENAVKDRTFDLEEEKQRSESLLLNILPAETAEELMTKGSAAATHYDSCTVLFTDFAEFTNSAEQLDPEELVRELDHCFRAFDRICDTHGVEKIKTIGDAYMCACGLPVPKEHHAVNALLAALEMLNFMERYNAKKQKEGKSQWPIRIGLHSGPLVAGVVGEKKFAYDIWGDTVNLASRMESNSDIGRINISRATKQMVERYFETEARGPIEVKNKGKVEMFFMNGIKDTYSIDKKRRFPNDKMKIDLGHEPNTSAFHEMIKANGERK